MAEVVREKSTIQIRGTRGAWKTVTGIYPKEWICALPECNRATKSSNRLISRKKNNRTYCSPECRAIHLGRLRRKKKK